MQKLCYYCKVKKDISEFYKNRSRPDGLETRCKACTKERNKKYREEHKDYFVKKMAEYYRNNKEILNEKSWTREKKVMENSASGLKNYKYIHELMRGIKEKPDVCERCYKHKPLELASIDHVYSLDPLEWKYLCRICHIALDKK